MSTPGGGGASRGITAKPTPPLKGSFPLDHFGECKHFMLAYAKCMKVRTALFPTECAAPAAGSPAPRRLPLLLLTPLMLCPGRIRKGAARSAGRSPRSTSTAG